MPVYPSDITEQNVQRLKQRWTFRTHGYVTAKPLFFRNRMLICDWDGYIYCLNAVSGKVIYEKQLYQPPKENAFLRAIPIVNRFLGEPLPYLWRGFAGTGCLSDDIWYLASVGGKEDGMLTNGAPGRLYAVYAEDGTILWEQALSEQPYSGSLAVPACAGDKLYVGLCSVDETASVVYQLKLKPFTPQCVGEVFCFQKNSGRLQWHKRATEFISGDDSRSTGVGIWGGFSVDSTHHLLYFATGNSYTQPVSKASDSVLCVDSLNGDFRWSFQAQAGDAWLPIKKEGPDFDFGCTPILFPCRAAESGYAAGAGNKNGFLYALDSKTGTLLWQANCHINAESDDGIRSNITYHNGHIYVWSKNKTPSDSISVNCIDANSGKIVWNKIESGTNAMTTGIITNNLYFMANYSGDIYALRTDDGECVWSGSTKVSFGSDLALWNNTLYAGFGVPLLYGGRYQTGGVTCFALTDNIENQ